MHLGHHIVQLPKVPKWSQWLHPNGKTQLSSQTIGQPQLNAFTIHHVAEGWCEKCQDSIAPIALLIRSLMAYQASNDGKNNVCSMRDDKVLYQSDTMSSENSCSSGRETADSS